MHPRLSNRVHEAGTMAVAGPWIACRTARCPGSAQVQLHRAGMPAHLRHEACRWIDMAEVPIERNSPQRRRERSLDRAFLSRASTASPRTRRCPAAARRPPQRGQGVVIERSSFQGIAAATARRQRAWPSAPCQAAAAPIRRGHADHPHSGRRPAPPPASVESSSASARCAAFGTMVGSPPSWARRHCRSHARAQDRAAKRLRHRLTSSIRTCAQIPSGSRKVESPDSRLIPAPVSTTIGSTRAGHAPKLADSYRVSGSMRVLAARGRLRLPPTAPPAPRPPARTARSGGARPPCASGPGQPDHHDVQAARREACTVPLAGTAIFSTAPHAHHRAVHRHGVQLDPPRDGGAGGEQPDPVLRRCCGW